VDTGAQNRHVRQVCAGGYRAGRTALAQTGAAGRQSALRFHAARRARVTHAQRPWSRAVSLRDEEPARRDGAVAYHDPDAAPAARTAQELSSTTREGKAVRPL